ncbi:MAG: tetratricopeptide repeat protein [Halieaceae bacterium]|jgi:tetratricopeptide (TPR) repeat protein|nr:tetratricopeptide repeat protein [Halieaceae bacterium]
MKRAIRELRRRGVIRAAGLYIALTWLLLQIADVVFPAFDLPDSALRYILFGAVVGFPLAMVFSWFYDISSEGIRSEEELREAGESGKGSYLSGATIVLLVVALGVSLYANYEQASEDIPATEHEIISILVSDFVNETGDPIFTGSLEPALAIGIEAAPFISSYARHQAAIIAGQIAGREELNEETARLVSVREGIRLVLSGVIRPDGEGYYFSLRAVDPREGEVIANASASAGSKVDVLPAVGKLAIQIREELGDASLSEDPEANETFTAASLEAAQYYTIAQNYNRTEQNELASEYYQKAIAEDPNFGRAYSGWALSERRLGRSEHAKELWEKTLTLLDTMTERERYRTQGAYYLAVTGNFRKAIEAYEELITRYPADNVGRNNLALAYFWDRQFDQALTIGGELVELYPNTPVYRSNYALYAMYASDFDLARSQATALLEAAPEFFLGYLPLAIAELAQGKYKAAEEVYSRMAKQGSEAESAARRGLADVALYRGDWPLAQALLEEGIRFDEGIGNNASARRKQVDLALALFEQGRVDDARVQLEAAIAGSSDLRRLLPAARLFVRLGDTERADELRALLDSELRAGSRAAADIIAAYLAEADGDTATAVDHLNASLEHVDTWLARFELGRVYANAGYFVEALSELERAEGRLGEAAALFLDEVPTFHYSATLDYWLGLTRQELGLGETGKRDLEAFLALRGANAGSAVVADARSRLEVSGK